MNTVSTGWRRRTRWLLVFALLAAGGGLTSSAQAQYADNWGYDADALTGIEQAVSRHYSDDNASLLGAFVFRFDSEANALAGLEAMDADHSDPSWTDSAIEIEELGPDTRAYASESEIAGISADILTMDGSYVYIAAISTYTPGVDAVGITTATIQAMISAEAGEGLGEFDDIGGASIGGLWDKLPAGDGQSPAGFRVDYDQQFYPDVEESGEGAIDFAALEGSQRAVGRSYSGDLAALSTPETVIPGIYFLALLVAEFDTADHASASFDTVYETTVDDLLVQFSLTMEDVESGDLGDQARATTGTGEQDGLPVELCILVVQDGQFVYVVTALGVGENPGSIEKAKEITETIVDAPAGSDEGEYDDTGNSTGGLWDKFPAAGDDVLGDLVPEQDYLVYP